MNSLRLPSYAKINLGLIIKGKRSDGYHEIETILQQVDLNDTLEIKIHQEPEIIFSCDNPAIPSDDSNLCVKAANLLQHTADVKSGAEIKLSKIIPVGAGLGGGSSNAAVVLLGLNKLWGLKLPSKKLRELGSKLGSDVPFFIEGGTAIGRGRGEVLTPFILEDNLPILIVYPERSVSTQWAYAQLNLNLTLKEKNITFRTFEKGNLTNVSFLKSIRNEFEKVVFEEYPMLTQIKEKMYLNNAVFAGMSGSGSTIFGVFQNKEEILRVRKKFEQYRTFLVQPIKWGYDQLN